MAAVDAGVVVGAQLFEEEEVYSRILVRMMPERVIENLLSSQSLVTVATPGVSVIFAEIVHDFDIRRAPRCCTVARRVTRSIQAGGGHGAIPVHAVNRF